jgi:hypothetical protein
MTHFLYFKKLRDLSGEKIDTEYPSQDWLISEIVAPIIVNSDKVQSIVHCRDEPLHSPDPDIITPKKLKRVIALFNKYDDLLEFRDAALKELEQE